MVPLVWQSLTEDGSWDKIHLSGGYQDQFAVVGIRSLKICLLAIFYRLERIIRHIDDIATLDVRASGIYSSVAV